MKLLLTKTGSTAVHRTPKISYQDHDSVTRILLPGKNYTYSRRVSLHLEIKNKKDFSRRIRRGLWECDMIRSVHKVSNRFSSIRSRSFPDNSEDLLEEEGDGSVILKNKKVLGGDNYNDRVARSRAEAEIDVLENEIEFSSGGIGKGRNIGGGRGGDISGDDESKIGAHYQQILKLNPGNPLLLGNYAKFLHEVERDVVRAEEYYERAILASPAGDGELFSLYGKLIWETHRDGERARGYFDQAVQASPHDCLVLGSYTHFLWDAEDEDDDEEPQLKTNIFHG